MSDDASVPGASRARQLFRYIGGDEWNDYRAILEVFAGTFFADFTPDDVAASLRDSDVSIDLSVVPDRLESLRRWGNLTVSSSVGNPSSLDDYYRRRNRYLITREGQEVFDLVERILDQVDEIGDVQAGRLRDLQRGLVKLISFVEVGLDQVAADDLADAVRNVFDPHEAFTVEITQFFAELNQWQSRYDLNADEVQFFAGVLVDYVSEQLTEIERTARPIARSLQQLGPDLDQLVVRLHTGLASRVDEAGMTDRVAVRRLAGSRRADWDHLTAWFEAQPGRVSRLDQLTRQAVAAVRTLTANLTRLSRVGLGAASRRADFVRLARWFDAAEQVDRSHDLAAAAFGLGSCRHLGVFAADVDDPVSTLTSWIDAPPANVPVSLRQRGEVTARGGTTPIRDRSLEREMLRRRRDQQRQTAERTAIELLACTGPDDRIDGAELSVAAFARLRDLISRSSHRAAANAPERSVVDGGLCCTVRRVAGVERLVTTVTSPEGRFTMFDVEVLLTASAERLNAQTSPAGAG